MVETILESLDRHMPDVTIEEQTVRVIDFLL